MSGLVDPPRSRSRFYFASHFFQASAAFVVIAIARPVACLDICSTEPAIYTAATGTITDGSDPELPYARSSRRECSKTVRAPDGHAVLLSFDRMDLYYEDDLFLHNGAEATTTNKLGTFKGSKKPAPIIALQGNLTLLWKVVGGVPGGLGFGVTWSFVPIPNTTASVCEARPLTGASGTLRAFPAVAGRSAYPPGVFCARAIQVPVNAVVQLKFHDFDLDKSGATKLRIYSGSGAAALQVSPMKTYTSDTSPVLGIVETFPEHVITLVWSTNPSTTGSLGGRGWELEFWGSPTTVSICAPVVGRLDVPRQKTEVMKDGVCPQATHAYIENMDECGLAGGGPVNENGSTPTDPVFKTRPYGCYEAQAIDDCDVIQISRAECPDNPDLDPCNLVAPGELCEGDGECGTDKDLDNCDSYDVYRKKTSLYFNTVGMKTDGDIDAPWRSICKELPPEFSGPLKFDDGTLTDPGSTSGEYPRSPADCTKTITAPANKTVQITFLRFDLNYQDDFDIYEGGDKKGNRLGRFSGDAVPEPLVSSTGSLTFVWDLVTGISSSETGFELSWKFVDKPMAEGICDPTPIFGTSGTVVSSPEGERTHYPPGVMCTRTISVSPGSAIAIDFTSFDVYTSGSTMVGIYAGTSTSVFLRKFTEDDPPPPVPEVIPLDTITVRWATSTSSSRTGAGWAFDWTADNKTISICSTTIGAGEAIDFDDGTLTDPGSTSGEYPRSPADCTKTITAPANKTVQITFLRFDLNYQDDFDIYEGGDKKGNRLGRFSGDAVPEPLVSSTGSLTFVWDLVTGISSSETGFELSWKFVDKPMAEGICDPTPIFGTSGTVVSSPEGERTRYPPGVICSRTIQVPQGEVALNFSFFAVGDSTTLTLYSGGSAISTNFLHEFSRSSPMIAGHIEHVPTDTVTLRWKTNSRAVQESSQMCGKLVPIESSDCPGNQDGRNCDDIKVGELCEGDGECNTDKDLDNCPGDYDYYRRIADSQGLSYGWNLEWYSDLSIVRMCSAGTTHISESTETITDPGATSGLYPRTDRACTKTISVPTGYAIRIDFKRCDLYSGDSLSVIGQDDEKLLGITGSFVPEHFVVSSGSVTFEWTLGLYDSSGTGFSAQWTSVDQPEADVVSMCGHRVVNGSSGRIKAALPSQTGDYFPNTDCALTLSVPDGNSIVLQFMSYDVASGSLLEFYRGAEIDDTAFLVRFDSSTKATRAPEVFGGSLITLHWSSGINTGRGFEVHWAAEPSVVDVCSTTSSLLTFDYGTIMDTSSTSGKYERIDDVCTQTIEAPAGMGIQFVFGRLKLNAADSLELFEGNFQTSNRIARFSGTTSPVPPTIVSMRGTLVIRWSRVLSKSSSATGFSGNWSFIEASSSFEKMNFGSCAAPDVNFILNITECTNAALMLGLLDTVANFDRGGGRMIDPLSDDTSDWEALPFGCYYKVPDDHLWFNLRGRRDSEDTDRISLCRRVTPVLETPVEVCDGAVLEAAIGTIRSTPQAAVPNGRGRGYLPGMQCVKTINFTGTGALTLTFSVFEVASGATLSIFDGSNTSGMPLTSLDETFMQPMPGRIEVIHSEVITLVWSTPITHAGFDEAGFIFSFQGDQTIVSVCGDEAGPGDRGALTFDKGTITDPSATGGSYARWNESCTKTIQAPKGLAIEITFDRVAFETSDVLRLYDGADTSTNRLIEVMGTQVPQPLMATSGSVTFHWARGSSAAELLPGASGFEARWQFVRRPETKYELLTVGTCPTATHAFIETNAECESAIQALKLDSSTTQGNAEAELRPYGCYYKWTNSEGSRAWFNSLGEKNSSETERVSVCRRVVDASDDSICGVSTTVLSAATDTLASYLAPGRNRYPPGALCNRTIVVPSGRVALNFTKDFQVDNSGDTVLQVYEKGELVLSFDSTHAPSKGDVELAASDSVTLIWKTSQVKKGNEGWALTWQSSKSANVCEDSDKVLTAATGSITDPSIRSGEIPMIFGQSETSVTGSCTRTIKAAYGETGLSFSRFDLQDGCSLVVYDGENIGFPVLANYTAGDSSLALGQAIVSSKGTLTISLTRSCMAGPRCNGGTGFEAKWEQEGSVPDDIGGTISFPTVLEFEGFDYVFDCTNQCQFFNGRKWIYYGLEAVNRRRAYSFYDPAGGDIDTNAFAMWWNTSHWVISPRSSIGGSTQVAILRSPYGRPPNEIKPQRWQFFQGSFWINDTDARLLASECEGGFALDSDHGSCVRDTAATRGTTAEVLTSAVTTHKVATTILSTAATTTTSTTTTITATTITTTSTATMTTTTSTTAVTTDPTTTSSTTTSPSTTTTGSTTTSVAIKASATTSVNEINSTAICEAGERACANGLMCLKVKLFCDGSAECEDGSDEGPMAGCPLDCKLGYSPCKGGSMCIFTKYMCDGGIPDCPDGSDEANCLENEANEPTTGSGAAIGGAFAGITVIVGVVLYIRRQRHARRAAKDRTATIHNAAFDTGGVRRLSRGEDGSLPNIPVSSIRAEYNDGGDALYEELDEDLSATYEVPVSACNLTAASDGVYTLPDPKQPARIDAQQRNREARKILATSAAQSGLAEPFHAETDIDAETSAGSPSAPYQSNVDAAVIVPESQQQTYDLATQVKQLDRSSGYLQVTGTEA